MRSVCSQFSRPRLISHFAKCVPEQKPLKRKVISELDSLAPDETIIASNSSSYACSQILAGLALKNESRVLSAHTCKLSDGLLFPLIYARLFSNIYYLYIRFHSFADSLSRLDWPPEVPGKLVLSLNSAKENRSADDNVDSD